MPPNQPQMRYKITYALPAQLVDHDGSTVASEKLSRKLHGFACYSDSVLNYAEWSFLGECDFRGGNPRLVVDEKQKLTVTVEVDSPRRLSRTELGELKKDFNGQLADGIGAGCFDELSRAIGISVELRFPLKPKCTQVSGTAWRPKASTEKGNARRIADAAKIIAKLDTSPSASTSSPGQKITNRPAATKSTSNKPSLKKLFRLLAKVERDQLFEQIRSGLEACGNDLSMVGDGELPYMNFNDPKLLRLLLKADLPAETTDEKGHSLLIQAVANPKSVELLLKKGVDVNRVCKCYDDSTALIRAARLGQLKSVEVLLNHGADPGIKNQAGRTALDHVDKRSRNRERIVRLLKSVDNLNLA